MDGTVALCHFKMHAETYAEYKMKLDINTTFRLRALQPLKNSKEICLPDFEDGLFNLHNYWTHIRVFLFLKKL